MGTPLCDRIGEGSEDHVNKELDEHIIAACEMIKNEYGDCDASNHAIFEMKQTVKTNDITAKRALFLYSMFADEPVASYFKKHEQSSRLAQDLRQRVLPFIVPLFIKNSCQSPDGFVLFSMVLAEMWQGETLGNFPPPEKSV